MSTPPIDYLRWAKSLPTDLRHNLARSGISPVTTPELGPDFGALPLSGENADGLPALKARLAAEYGVDVSRVFTSLGASMAFYQLCSALIKPGDHVAVETPVYEPLYRVPQLLGAEVSFFERCFADRFSLPMAALRQAINAGCRLIILSHPHNPSGQALDLEQLMALAELLDDWDGYVICDEVYLDLCGGAERSLCRFHERAISIGSLTKGLGFPGLRCGWAIAPASVVEQAVYLNDFMAVVNPFPTEVMAQRILGNKQTFLVRAQGIIRQARPLMDAFVSSQPAVEWVPPSGGIIGWLRLREMDSSKFARYLFSNYRAVVVDGAYFRQPGFLRIGFGLPPAALERALDDLAAAIRAFSSDPFANM